MENAINLSTQTTVATETCSREGDVQICSSVHQNQDGGYTVTSVFTFAVPYIVSVENTRNEVLKLSEEDREVIRVREIRYDAVPGTGGVTNFEDAVTVLGTNYNFEEIVTVSLQDEPESYARPKAPKSILVLNDSIR